MPQPQANPAATDLRGFAGAAWAEPLIRTGLLLFALQLLCLGALTIDAYAAPSQLPKNASLQQIWRALPQWERCAVIALAAAFAVSTILIGWGALRMNRRAGLRLSTPDWSPK
jgi:hypothetical protein